MQLLLFMLYCFAISGDNELNRLSLWFVCITWNSMYTKQMKKSH